MKKMCFQNSNRKKKQTHAHIALGMTFFFSFEVLRLSKMLIALKATHEPAIEISLLSVVSITDIF